MHREPLSYSKQVRCLVTGGAGFIGRHLTDRLMEFGVERLVMLDNLSRGIAPASEQPQMDFVIGDVRDMEQLQRAMRGCHIVFHLAAEATVMGCEKRPAEAHTVNVTGTCNVLAAANTLGVRRVIFASSREVYGEPAQLPVSENSPLLPKNVYGASKAAAEMYCHWYASKGLEVTAVRLANVYGPGDRGRVIPLFISHAVAGTPLTLYGGGQIIDFIWIRKAVDALMRAAFGLYVPGCINIGSGVGVTLLQAAHRILQLSGSASEIRVLPAREAEVSRFLADIRRAQRELGLTISADPLWGLKQMMDPISSESYTNRVPQVSAC